MDKVRETLWHENWSEARKAKEQRRTENREKWTNSLQNAANRYKQILDAAPEITADTIDDAGSGSLAKMRAIHARSRDTALPQARCRRSGVDVRAGTWRCGRRRS
jgi:hypothetical protein